MSHPSRPQFLVGRAVLFYSYFSQNLGSTVPAVAEWALLKICSVLQRPPQGPTAGNGTTSAYTQTFLPLCDAPFCVDL